MRLRPCRPAAAATHDTSHEPGHRRTAIHRTAARIVATLAVAAITLAGPALATASASVVAPSAVTTTVPPTDTTNPFLPEEASLGDCLSALPPPNCGSEARGGFAQWSVLAVLVAGLAFIGWRVVRGARRNARAAASQLAAAPSESPSESPGQQPG